MIDIQVELTKDADGRDLAVARFDRHPEMSNSPMTLVTVEIIQSGYSDNGYAMHILSHVREDTREIAPLHESERRAVLYSVAEAIDTHHWELRAWADQFDDYHCCEGVCWCDPC